MNIEEIEKLLDEFLKDDSLYNNYLPGFKKKTIKLQFQKL